MLTDKLRMISATQVEQRRLREGAAAMAAELVSLRQHVAMLTQPAGNGFIPPPRSSPGVPSPPQGYSSALSPGPSQSQLSPNLFQVSFLPSREACCCRHLLACLAVVKCPSVELNQGSANVLFPQQPWERPCCGYCGTGTPMPTAQAKYNLAVKEVLSVLQL